MSRTRSITILVLGLGIVALTAFTSDALRLSCILVAAPSGAVPAGTTETLDQEFDALSGPGSVDGEGVGFTNSSDDAQTFTVGMTGRLTRVDLQLFIDAIAQVPTQDLVVEIRPTVNGVPDNNDTTMLAKTTVKPATVPIGWPNAGVFTSVDFSTAQLLVTQGDVLAIVLRTADTATGYFWTTKENSTYSAGGKFFRNRFYPRFQSSNRVGGILVDSGFRTFVEPQHTTTGLSPIADAYVRAGTFASANFGRAPTLVAKKGVSPDNTRRSYMKFDISSVISVERARLRLYGHLSNASTREAVTTVYAVSDTSWDERAVTWNTRPNLDAVVGQVTISGTTPQGFEIDVTRFVRGELLAGRTVVSIALRDLAQSSAFTEFASRESGNVAPQLLIWQ